MRFNHARLDPLPGISPGGSCGLCGMRQPRPAGTGGDVSFSDPQTDSRVEVHFALGRSFPRTGPARAVQSPESSEGFVAPESSRSTFGSSPTTHASWPGRMIARSPGPNSSSVPSSMSTICRPERKYFTWHFWHVSVFTTGLTCSDHFQPGSSVSRARSRPPIVTDSMVPFAKGFFVSSGDEKLFFTIDFMISPAVLVVTKFRIEVCEHCGCCPWRTRATLTAHQRKPRSLRS